MAFEIEHKYLVKDDTYRKLAFEKIEIAQGYLNRVPERTVRVRIANDSAYLTVKGKNRGDMRLEFEYQVPVADARIMLTLCEPGIIEKTRYKVDWDGNVWEVDEFHGAKEGLVLAEIELSESTHSYTIPPFVGMEVTGNPAYYNSSL